MKFRGDYTVVGKMTSKEVVAPKITIDNMTVNKAFTLAASVTTDMGSNPLKKLGAPVDAADAATKQFVEDTSIAVTVRAEVPDFKTDVIVSKPNDLLLIGYAPGPIQCSDARVVNKDVFDVDCSLTNNTVYALVKDSTNALISSKDGGKTWSYVKKMLADFGDGGTTSDAKKYRYITSTSDNKLLAFRGKMASDAMPAESTNGGLTWNTISVSNLDRMTNIDWLPARLSKPSSGPVFLLNTTADISEFFVLTYGILTRQLLQESIDAAAKPSGRVVSAASYGDILVIITSAGETVVRTAQNNYRRGGTLPQTGVTWNDVVAIDANTWVACSGTGLSKSYVAISTNQGASWTQKEVSASNISLTGIHYNVKAGAQGTLIVTGQNAAYISTDKGATWTITENYKIPASQNVTPVGTGFVVASTTGNFEILPSGTTWISDIEGEYFDMFFKTSSGWSKYTPGFNGDDYLPLSGGTMTGQIKLASSASITGLQAPTLPGDAVPKSYVDAKVHNLARRGVSQTAGTTFNNMIRISQNIETVKITVVGKGTDGTRAGRYYSEIAVVIDPMNLVGGKIQAESTEFAVISTGDLQVTASIPAVATSAPYIDVSFTANRSCNLEVIVEIVDLEADGEVLITGERTV